MKAINQLFASAVLAICATTSAHADTTSGTTYLLMDAGQPGVATTRWSFGDEPNGALDDPFQAPHAQGGEFDDFFIFNVPDSETITFAVNAKVQGGAYGVDFVDKGNGGYALFRYADGAVLDQQAAGSSIRMSGGAWALSSGTYALEFAGAYAVKGGYYDGAIDGIPLPVPEPSAAGMLLLGLACLAGATRLRKTDA